MERERRTSRRTSRETGETFRDSVEQNSTELATDVQYRYQLTRRLVNLRPVPEDPLDWESIVVLQNDRVKEVEILDGMKLYNEVYYHVKVPSLNGVTGYIHKDFLRPIDG